jgi:hypothetical protein
LHQHIKHIKVNHTSSYYVITEFINDTPWADIHNTISCAAGHHIREARWLHNPKYVEDYIYFWLRDGNPRQYSFWFAYSTLSYVYVTSDFSLLNKTYQGLLFNYNKIRLTNFDLQLNKKNHLALYYNTDNRDGMESSIGGREYGTIRAYRPTLNSYQYGDGLALSKIARYLGRNDDADVLMSQISELKKNILDHLWDPESSFFKVIPLKPQLKFVTVRELHGYTPWYFNIPGSSYNVAWKELINISGFQSLYGLTTAEQRHSKFVIDYTDSHECLWNGPIWPYATSVTLTALSNLLQKSKKSSYKHITAKDYFNILKTYAYSHYRIKEDVKFIVKNSSPKFNDFSAKTKFIKNLLYTKDFELFNNPELMYNYTRYLIPWIDENMDPYTGFM